MQNKERKFRVTIVAASLLLANSACAFDMGNMMNPSKWMDSNKVKIVTMIIMTSLVTVIQVGPQATMVVPLVMAAVPVMVTVAIPAIAMAVLPAIAMAVLPHTVHREPDPM